jgi:glutamyl-tRNA synthetase
VFAAVAGLVQTRVAVLSEVVSYVDFLFLDRPAVDQAAWDKAMSGAAGELLAAVLAAFRTVPAWDAATLKTTVEEIGNGYGLKLGKAQAPVRVAVTGRAIGLPLFESLEILGRERAVDRIATALEILAG